MAVSECIRECRRCGKEFRRTSKGQPTKYCGAQCRDSVKYRKTAYPQDRHCRTCGTTFVAYKASSTYCTKSCRPKKKRRAGAQAPRFREAACTNCGSTFQSQPSGKSEGGWTRCCSRACARLLRGRIRRAAERTVVAVHRQQCEGCGSRFSSPTPRTYCQPACRASTYRWEPVRVRCHECGQGFIRAKKWQQVCSDECGALMGARQRRIDKARRRARVRGNTREAIDPISVFERDKWQCHICHRATPKRLRGTADPRAPELDHIVALAVGGSHTWSNVACCCKQCNNRKGVKSLGQLNLPIAA